MSRVVCGCPPYLRYLRAVGHAATFAVHATLVAGQWQHPAWNFHLHPAAEHEAEQAKNSVFHVCGVTHLVFKSSLSASVARALSH